MKFSYLLLPAALLILFSAAARVTTDQSPIGAVDEIYVVMDSTDWNSDTAMAIRETFGRNIETVPTYENAYTLKFMDFDTNDQLDRIQEYKNVIFAATSGPES